MGLPQPITDVIIPAYNEQESIALVVQDIPDFVRHIIVVNNNSTDKTGEKALAAGAIVLEEPQRGYGKACLKGMAYLLSLEVQPQTVVFLDADYSDYPAEMEALIKPLAVGEADLVIGSRAKGIREPGSMT